MAVLLRGFEASSLIIQRVGFRFHAHLLKINSRQPRKLRETLGSRKDRHTNQLQVREAENGKSSRFGLSEYTGSDKHFKRLGLSESTRVKSDFGC